MISNAVAYIKDKKSLKLVIKKDDKTKFTEKLSKIVEKIKRNKYFGVYLNNFDKHSLQFLKHFKKKFDH